MPSFSAYEKMPTSLKKLGLKEADYAAMEKLQWVVTEKVHGANFSFFYENGQLGYAKRKSVLSWQDDFFGFQLVVKKLGNQIISLFEELSTQLPANQYRVYGELFGGAYPHPEVAPAPEVQAIQTGVYYTPDIRFCAFDIAIELEGPESKYYLEYETAARYFEKHGILYAKPLFIGKMGEAMHFDTRINSTLPRQLGLPELAENLIEGVVIKPYNLTDHQQLGTRPIVKLKNKEFEEEKFHEAQKWTYIPSVSTHTEDLSFILEELRNYVTPNRLESAISKIGALDQSNPDRVAEIEAEFLRDTLEDFNGNNEDLLAELTAGQQSWLADRVLAEIRRLMRP